MSVSKKTLLLNSNYEALGFLPERKVFKLLFKDKTEVISNWNDDITWASGSIKHPAILRMKYHIKRTYVRTSFSRKALIKRDNSSCQYCGKRLIASQITIDHVIPRAQGGGTSFSNCVVSCHTCNNKKADHTPEQANMALLKQPIHPSFTNYHCLEEGQEFWHNDWDAFLQPI